MTGVYNQFLQEKSATTPEIFERHAPLRTFVCVEIGRNGKQFGVRLSQTCECVAGGGAVCGADEMVIGDLMDESQHIREMRDVRGVPAGR
jgi:hypothetical protein